MFRAYQLTIPVSGVARASDAYFPVASYPGGIPGETTAEFAKQDVPLRMVSFQALKAASTDFFIGDAATVSSSIHAIRVDPADTAPPIILAPGGESGPLKLSDFYIAGTAGAVLTIGTVPY